MNHIAAAWPCYRLVHAGWATLEACHHTLTRSQVLDACDALDAIEEAQAERK